MTVEVTSTLKLISRIYPEGILQIAQACIEKALRGEKTPNMFD